MVFQFIPLADFDRGYGTTPWLEQQRNLKRNLPTHPYIHMVPQYPLRYETQLWQHVQDTGREGLMYAYGPATYEGKRTKHLLKRKQTEDGEYEVEELSFSQQLIPGTYQKQKALERVGITHAGRRVWVGNGFTWEEKIRAVTHPHTLLHHTIKVRHNGLTQSRNHTASLRHARKIE
jgi:ATP-dependent DNA ligase